MTQERFDVMVIGSGAAGLAAATQLGSVGKRVAVVERDRYLGGECPNYACVPTKALLHIASVYRGLTQASELGLKVNAAPLNYRAVRAYQDHVVSQTGGRNLTAKKLALRGITLIRGEASFSDQRTLRVSQAAFTARHFIIATGTSTLIPPLDGIDRVPYLTSKQAVELTELPESLIIVGGGPVGVEFATIFASLGSDVTILQKSDRLLDREEPEVAQLVAESLTELGVTIVTEFTAEQVEGDRTSATIVGHERSRQRTFSAERLLLATGMQPNVRGLNLDKIGVRLGRRGVETDQYLRSSLPHIWAAGDVTGHQLYTHAAHYEGSIVAHNILHREKRRLDLRVIPRGVYSVPEVGSVGQTEAELRARGRAVVVGWCELSRLGRSLTDQTKRGFVKIIADARSGQVLGAAIVAPRAGEMIHELALAMKARVAVEVIADLVHAFPTYSEAVLVAADDAASKLET